MGNTQFILQYLEQNFNKTYESAMNDKNYANKKHKIESMRNIMLEMNVIKERSEDDVEIQEIVFTKQIDMAEKFSSLANNILGNN